MHSGDIYNNNNKQKKQKGKNMKKAIFAICLVVAMTSCNSVATQNDSVTDSTAQLKADTTTGIQIDSTKVDSVATDSVKSVK